MFILLTLIIGVVVALSPNLAWTLLIMPGLYVLYASFIALIKPPEIRSDIGLSSYEVQIAKKYSAYLQAPIAAPAIARGLSGIALILFIVGLTLIFRDHLVEGVVGIIGALYIYITPILSRLNPSAGIVAHAKKGNAEAIREVNALQSIQEKAKY